MPVVKKIAGSSLQFKSTGSRRFHRCEEISGCSNFPMFETFETSWRGVDFLPKKSMYIYTIYSTHFFLGSTIHICMIERSLGTIRSAK